MASAVFQAISADTEADSVLKNVYRWISIILILEQHQELTQIIAESFCLNLQLLLTKVADENINLLSGYIISMETVESRETRTKYTAIVVRLIVSDIATLISAQHIARLVL